MLDKGKIASIVDGKATVIPFSTKDTVTFLLDIPEHLEDIQVNSEVLYTVFDDCTGMILSSFSGSKDAPVSSYSIDAVTDEAGVLFSLLRAQKEVSSVRVLIDSEMDPESINPVQNKAIYMALTTVTKRVETVQGDLAEYKTVITEQLTAKEAKITKISGDLAEYKTVVTDELKAKSAEIEVITGNFAEFKTMTTRNFAATVAQIEEVSGNLATYKTIVAEQITAKEAEIVKISGDLAEYKTVISDIVKSIQGDFEDLRTKALMAEAADLRYATIGKFDALDGYVKSLEGEFTKFKTGEFEDLRAKTLTAETADLLYANIKLTNIATGTITNAMIGKGQIEDAHILEGTIGSSKIHDLSASKLSAGIADLSLVTLRGTDGKIQIADNTIQIKDASRVRVQIGKDAGNDYTLAVWDAVGNLIWDALGATDKTIQRKIIRDNMVSDNAGIQGYKLDIDSVITSVNGATTKINGTKVQVGDKSLNVLLSEQTETLTSQGQTLATHETAIKANENSIKLKVSNSVYQEDIAGVTKRLTTAETTIVALDKEIALKASQKDVSGLVNRMENAELKLTKDAIISAVSGTYATTNALAAVDGKFANYSTTAQINSAIEQKANSITSTVSNTYATKTEASAIKGTADNAKSAIDNLEIGGRNLVINTKTFAGWPKNTSISVQNDANGFGIATWSTATTLSWRQLDSTPTIKFVNVKGKQATFSLMVRSDQYEQLNADVSHGLYLAISLCTADSIARTKYAIESFCTTQLSNQWTKIKWSITLSDSVFTNGIGDITDTSRLYVQVYNYSTYSMQVKQIKLELGNRATDWTPAIEDVDNSITDVETVATQTANKFNWLVKSGTSESNFTLTDRVATLAAQYINLNGLVTFGGLNSEAQGKVNDAIQTAAAAKLANEVETISSNMKKYKNVCGFTSDAANVKGALIITTPITPSRMVSIHIKGYNYVGTQETIDLTIGFYNYANDMVQHGFVNNGSMKFDSIKVAKISASDTRAVIIVGNASTTWQYPKIIVDEVITGYSTVCPDSYKDGFSATITASIPTTYVHTASLSGTDFKTQINATDSVIAGWCYNNDKTYINGGKIYTGSVTTKQLAANSVTADKIAVGSVTADKMSVNSLQAISAKIGGFTIGSSYIANNSTILAGVSNSVYLGLDGISCGTTFKVDKAGALTATSGKIGGFTIGTSYLASEKKSLNDETSGVYLGTDGISCGLDFKVDKLGVLEARYGHIGEFEIGAGYLGGHNDAVNFILDSGVSTQGAYDVKLYSRSFFGNEVQLEQSKAKYNSGLLIFSCNNLAGASNSIQGGIGFGSIPSIKSFTGTTSISELGFTFSSSNGGCVAVSDVVHVGPELIVHGNITEYGYINMSANGVITSLGSKNKDFYHIYTDAPSGFAINGDINMVGNKVIGTTSYPAGGMTVKNNATIGALNASKVRKRLIGMNTDNHLFLGEDSGTGGFYTYITTGCNIMFYAGTSHLLCFGSYMNADNKRVFRSEPVYDRTTSGGSVVRVGSTGILYRYVSSSRRYKEDITQDLCSELNPSKLYDIEIVEFKYREGQLAKSDERYKKPIIGFIAEDVESKYPIAANHNEDGSVETWNIDIVVPAMLKLVQEQHKVDLQLDGRIGGVESRIESLKCQLDQAMLRIAEQQKIIDRLEQAS